MRVKFFACSCRGDDETSDSIDQFLNSHRIVSVEKNFVQDGHASFWAICVTYVDQTAASRPPASKRGKVDYREILPQAEFAVFAKLRNLRKQIADREGVPAYALFTNEQLAAMVTRRVSTQTALRDIDGVGEARIQKYGADVLAILRADLPKLRDLWATAMRRSGLDLEAIAEWKNMIAAYEAASRGKKDRVSVDAFTRNLDAELQGLREEILSGAIALREMSSFWIRDPKLRLIHAPCFRDRVLHHALMRLAGPVLERTLVFDTYACRVGKGTLAAVQRCQHHARRYPIFAKIDIKSFFPNIDHGVLNALLARRFKSHALLELFSQVIAGHQSETGKGLPIGSLTSQHFANFYLSGLDRFLLETRAARGMVRYMDDVIWWSESIDEARETLRAVEQFLSDGLRLAIKRPCEIGYSAAGVMFCGFKVLPGALRLSRRRRRRYSERRRF